jgi:uncharacterized membrane protein YgdD (TMEM256/DUF423 family)
MIVRERSRKFLYIAGCILGLVMVVFALFHAIHGRSDNATRFEQALIWFGVPLFGGSLYLLTRTRPQ